MAGKLEIPLRLLLPPSSSTESSFANISQNTFFRIVRLEIIKLELVLVGRSHADGHHVDVEKEETHNETLPQTDEDELDNQERITMVGEIAKKDQSDHEEDALDEDEHGDYLGLD